MSAARPASSKLNRFASALIAIVTLASAGCARSDTRVILHDRGREIALTGSQAEAVLAAVLEVLSGGGRVRDALFPMDGWVQMRDKEVAIELSFAKPRRFRLSGQDEHLDVQYVLVPLTGPLTGMSGNSPHLLLGQKAELMHRLYGWLGGEVVDGPDDRGIVYGSLYEVPEGLDRLRVMMAQLGVEAPRQQAPETTPDRAPLVSPPADEK